jgi:benzil reductase ((S)-benzoin forming)
MPLLKSMQSAKDVKRVVVNISSGAATKPIDGWSGYSASKAALNMLSLSAQAEAELDQTGIRFFAVAPGVVDTDMQQQIRTASQVDFSLLPKFIDLKKNNELSSPELAAEKILFLIKHAETVEGVIQDVRKF